MEQKAAQQKNKKKEKKTKTSVFYRGLHYAVHSKTLMPFSIC